MNETQNTWQNKEYNLQGLADFFNSYEIPLLGFGSSDKNKKIYVNQMSEIHEYVKPCLQVLMDEKHKKEYEGKEYNEELFKKIINNILNDLIKNKLVAEKQIEKVKNNLIEIYKDPVFVHFESIELSTYGERRVRDVIILLNNESFNLTTGDLLN